VVLLVLKHLEERPDVLDHLIACLRVLRFNVSLLLGVVVILLLELLQESLYLVGNLLDDVLIAALHLLLETVLHLCLGLLDPIQKVFLHLEVRENNFEVGLEGSVDKLQLEHHFKEDHSYLRSELLQEFKESAHEPLHLLNEFYGQLIEVNHPSTIEER